MTAHLVALVLAPALVAALADGVLGVVRGVVLTLPGADAVLAAVVAVFEAHRLGPSFVNTRAKLFLSTVIFC